MDMRLLKGDVSQDHIHMRLESPAYLSISVIVYMLMVCSSRLLQQDFSALKKRYWAQYFLATSYGVWSTGDLTEELVNEYLENHRRQMTDVTIISLLNTHAPGLSVRNAKPLFLVQACLVAYSVRLNYHINQ